MEDKHKSIWEFEGRDQLTKILRDIDRSIVKIDKDTARMEKDLTKAFSGPARSIDYLRDKMKRLEFARNSAFDPKRIRQYNQELSKTQREMEKLERLGMSRSQKWRGAMGQIPIANQLMGAATNPYVLGGMAAMGVGRMVSNSVSYSRNMNADMAKINATAQISPEKIAAMQEQFFVMANKKSIDVNTIPAAYEGLISATGDKAMADKLLAPALDLAIAGFTDANITGKALSQIMMTPGVRLNENQIADMLMSAKNYGRGELSDFAQYLPGLITTGKQRGFSEADVAGGYSYLTRSNSAEQASTLMQNFLNVVLRKDVTDEIRKRIKVDVFDKGKLRDMGSILADIGKAMSGLSDKGKQSFLDAIKIVDQQAFQALGSLTSESDKLNEAIQTINGSAGTLAKTLTYVKTGNESLVEFSNNWSKLKNNIGNSVAPIANEGLDLINAMFDGDWKSVGADWNFTDPGAYSRSRKEFADKNKPQPGKSEMAGNFFDKYGTQFLKNYTGGDDVDALNAAMMNLRKVTGGKWTDHQYSGAAGIFKKIQKGLSPEKKTTPDLDFSSETPDKLMSEHRQVRNVTITIDTIQRIMGNVNVSSNKELVEFTSEDALNELIKIARDAEVALDTY